MSWPCSVTTLSCLDGIKEHGAVLATVQQRMDGKVLWVIDSGATDHVCNDRSAFYSIQSCASPTRYRTAGNDFTSDEEGIMAMQLPDSKKLVLQDVTYLLSAPANLLSMGTLQQKGWTFDFANGYMALGSHRIRMYNVGPKGKQQKGKLQAICLPLVLPAPVVQPPAVRSIFVLSNEKDTLKNWHRRLAHIGVSTIEELAAAGRLQIAPSTRLEFKMEDCNVCAIAKATRLTFGDISFGRFRVSYRAFRYRRASETGFERRWVLHYVHR
jgi:hypothetical protein